MGDDLAAANVNRSSSLAPTSIAIFSFVLIFLYPSTRTTRTRGVAGRADGRLRAGPGRPAGRSFLAARVDAPVPRTALDRAWVRRNGLVRPLLIYVAFAARYFPRVQTLR